ncbi:hypothetical protein ACE6H2_018946 [Prunus campanulata]
MDTFEKSKLYYVSQLQRFKSREELWCWVKGLYYDHLHFFHPSFQAMKLLAWQ